MSIVTRDRLLPLLQQQSGPCVSIYIPTHRHHPGTEQDPIRFKNALLEAGRLLSDRHDPERIAALLDPLAALSTQEFWRHQSDGLAVLRSADVLEIFHLPQTVAELVVVADSFHVRPLIRTLASDDRYILVALSQKSPQVYEGSRLSLTPIAVPGLPVSLAEFVGERRDEPAAPASAESNGNRRAASAGRAPGAEEAELAAYFRAIDKALQPALREVQAPVILAGVEYYIPLYRQVSGLKRLADSFVPGSPSALTTDELRLRAWPVAESVLAARLEHSLEAYWRASARGKVQDRLEDIVAEARRGRVRRLFLAEGARVWGTVDPITGSVHRSEHQQGSHDDDVLDDVAESVMGHGGEVVTLPLTRMPEGREVLAELR